VAATVQRLGYLLLALSVHFPGERPEPGAAVAWRRTLDDAGEAVRSGSPVHRPDVFGLPGLWESSAVRHELASLYELLAPIPSRVGGTSILDRVS
jgi:hypothetical protein